MRLPSPILASAGVCRRREGRKTWRGLNFLPFKTAKTRKCPPILVLQGSLSMFLRSANPNPASVGAYKRRGGHKTRAKDTALNFDTFFLLVLIEVSIPNLGLLRNVLTKQAWASGLVNQGHLGTPKKHCS